MTHPRVTSYDAPPLSKYLILDVRKFLFSNDLLEGKKSTSVRTAAPLERLADGRAGVEFFLDTDGTAGRPSILARVAAVAGYRRTSYKWDADQMGWVRQGGEGFVSFKKLSIWQRSSQNICK